MLAGGKITQPEFDEFKIRSLMDNVGELMKQFGLAIRKIGSVAFGSILLVGIACLLLALFCLMPAGLAFETYDLVMIDSKAVGVVTSVDSKTHRGKSSTQITYEFSANGRTTTSKRVFPGFLGNKGGFSRSQILADQFPVDRKCDVYFDLSNPSRCTLKFGWFSWSVGFTAIAWGLYLSWFFKSRSSALYLVAQTTMFYGGGLLFVGPLSVDLLDIHWHLVAILCIAGAVSIYQFAAGKLTQTTDDN